jgi:hypothetical protein
MKPGRTPSFHVWTRRCLSCLIASILTQACGAGWKRKPLETLQPLPERQQVQIWSEGEMQRWHVLSITPDHLFGIPFHRPVDCDSCRLSIPRSDVDSVRLGNPTAGFWKTFALVVGIPVVTFIIVCSDDVATGPPCSE